MFFAGARKRYADIHALIIFCWQLLFLLPHFRDSLHSFTLLHCVVHYQQDKHGVVFETVGGSPRFIHGLIALT